MEIVGRRSRSLDSLMLLRAGIGLFSVNASV